MGTISLYPCQGTCYKEAALVTDSSATPTGTQFVWWSPPSPSSSSPAAAEVLGCATHCVVMIPTQWDGPRAGHLNYFKTVTADRLETQGQLKDQNLDVYAFLPHSTHPLLIISLALHSNFSELSPQKTIFVYHPGFSLPRRHGCPETFPVVPSSILPESLHLCLVPKHPYSCSSHSSKLTKATHSSFQILLSSYTNASLNVQR